MSTKTSGLQVQHLHTFCDVYRLGGYAAAAAESHLSVPSIWQHIQSLERLYGVRLFDKVGKRVKATEAGDRLFETASELLQRLESTYHRVNTDAQVDSSLTLVTGNRMLLEDLAEPLAAFHQRFGYQLVVRHGNNKLAEELLVADKADLAFSLEPGVKQRSRLIHYKSLYKVDFLAAAPLRHALAKRKSISLRQLTKFPLIVTTPGTHGRDALEQALHRERLQANIVVETDNSGFTIACVKAGMGVGILAGHLDGPLCQKLATRSLKNSLGQREIVALWRKGRSLDDAKLALLDEVIRHHT